MAFEDLGKVISAIAGADLSAGQYRFVDMASDGEIDLVGGQGLDAIGVLQDKPSAQGRVASVAVDGITKVVVGANAALVAGELVTSDALGGAEIAAAGDFILGKVHTGAAIAGLASVVLQIPGAQLN